MYHNLDPLARLIGKTNETKIEVDVECLVLTDYGAQLSTIPVTFSLKL